MTGVDAAPPGGAVLNAFAVDLEDYFQVSAFDGVVGIGRWPRMESRLAAATDRLLALFDEHHTRATFFVLGWNAHTMPGLIRRIAAAGHEIASHSFEHRLVYSLSREQFRDDLRRARLAIEHAAGVPVVGFRAPSYSITTRSLWAFDVLIEEGYLFDSSVYPIRHDRYGIPGASRHPYQVSRALGSLWEIPPPTVRLLGVNVPTAAGGYLRLLPLWWTSWGIRHINEREGAPAVASIHPWEIDPGQPRLDVGRLTTLRHYGNIGATEARLRRLLAQFRFGTISDVLAAHTSPRPVASTALAV